MIDDRVTQLIKSSNYSIGQVDDSHTNGLGNARLMKTPIRGNFYLESLTYYTISSGTSRVNLYKKNEDGTFKYLRKLVNIQDTGLKTINGLNQFIEDGTYIGVFSLAGNIGFEDTETAQSYTLSSETGENITVIDGNFIFDIMLEGKIFGAADLISLSNRNNVDDEVGKLLLDSGTDVTVGYYDNSNTSGGNGLRIPHFEPFEYDTRISRINVHVNNESNGYIIFIELERNPLNNTFKVTRTFNNKGNHFLIYKNTDTVLYTDFVVRKGRYLGFWATSGVITLKNSSENCSYSALNASLVNPMEVAIDNYQWDVQYIGKTIGYNEIKDDIEKIYSDEETLHFGNEYNNSTQVWTMSSMGNKYTIIIAEPLKYSGIVKKFYVKASGTAGVFDFFRAKKLDDNNNFDVVGWIGTYHINPGVNELNVGVFMEKDEYIAIYLPHGNSLGICWNNGETVYGCYTQTGDAYLGHNIPFTPRSAVMCFAYDLQRMSLEDFMRRGDNLPSDGYIFNTNYQSRDFAVTDDDWEEVTENRSWENFECSTPNSYIYFRKPAHMDRQVVQVEIKLVDLESVICICGKPYTSASNKPFDGGPYVKFDFENRVMSIHKALTPTEHVSGNPTVLESCSMFPADDFVQNRKYILEMEQDSTKTIKARIINGFTMEKIELVHINTSDYDSITCTDYAAGIIAKSGSIKVVNFAQFSKMPVRPTLMIYGDSFTQGWNLIRYHYDSDLCYSHLIENWLGREYTAISAVGGECTVDVITKIPTNFEVFRPKHVVLNLGFNDSAGGDTFNDWKCNATILINAARKYGAEVILVTTNGNDGIKPSQASWMRNYHIGFRIFEEREVLAVENGTTESDMFLPDGHPNVEGNKRMFEKFKSQFMDLLADSHRHIEPIEPMGTVRPLSMEIEKGFRFFDETLNKLIIWNGEYWIDCSGQRVTWPIIFNMTLLMPSTFAQPLVNSRISMYIAPEPLTRYKVPTSIDVKMGNNILTEGTDYTYTVVSNEKANIVFNVDTTDIVTISGDAVFIE